MTKYQTSKIKNIKKLDERFDRYDLTVGETSNFLANDILIHNTSAIFGNILCKKDLNIFKKIASKFNKNDTELEYKFIYSSRSIIKNRKDGKFTEDVWGHWANLVKEKIPNEYLFYGEIVGFTPNGSSIQKSYDYGCKQYESEFRVYRIVQVSPDGISRELEWYEIEELTEELGLVTVPVYYTGLAKDLFKNIMVDENWSDNFLKALKSFYLDKKCEICKNNVINEGVVLRIESNSSRPAFKFKSPLFNIAEGKLRDGEYEDIEELN